MDLILLLSGRPHKIITVERYLKSKDVESKDVSELQYHVNIVRAMKTRCITLNFLVAMTGIYRVRNDYLSKKNKNLFQDIFEPADEFGSTLRYTCSL